MLGTKILAVIAARGGDHAGFRDLAHEQVRESAARLERTRMLELLELEAQAEGAQSEIRPVDLDDRRSAYARSDESLGRCDLFAVDGLAFAHVRPVPSLFPLGRRGRWSP